MSARAAPPPVPLRHLDELEAVTREYATLTAREAGLWTMLGLSAWMVGAELLHRLSPGWGALAYLALSPLAVGLGLLELRRASPRGVVEWAPKDRWERAQRGYLRWGIGFAALAGEWLALFALYTALQELPWTELPTAAWLAAFLLFPAVAAAPAAAPFLLRGRPALLAAVLCVGTMAPLGLHRPAGGPWAQQLPLVVLAGAALLALLSLAGLGFRAAQLRLLDRRMAALRGRLL